MLWEIVPDRVIDQIQSVCVDMIGIYAPVARAMVPQAKVVHNRFHVFKHLNEAVVQVRRKDNKTLQANGDEGLKGMKHLFLFNPKKMPESRVAQFEELKNADLKTSRAWAMKKDFWEI